MSNICTNISPYFENNIVYNFMQGKTDKNYIDHKMLTLEDRNKNIELWRKKGYPDIILGNARLDLVFSNEEINYDDYSLVYLGEHSIIWKIPSISYYQTPIFIKKELNEKLGLKEIDKTELGI